MWQLPIFTAQALSSHLLEARASWCRPASAGHAIGSCTGGHRCSRALLGEAQQRRAPAPCQEPRPALTAGLCGRVRLGALPVVPVVHSSCLQLMCT